MTLLLAVRLLAEGLSWKVKARYAYCTASPDGFSHLMNPGVWRAATMLQAQLKQRELGQEVARLAHETVRQAQLKPTRNNAPRQSPPPEVSRLLRPAAPELSRPRQHTPPGASSSPMVDRPPAATAKSPARPDPDGSAAIKAGWRLHFPKRDSNAELSTGSRNSRRTR